MKIMTDSRQRYLERVAFNKGYIKAMEYCINTIQIDEFSGYDKATEDKIRSTLNAINVALMRRMNEYKTIEYL